MYIDWEFYRLEALKIIREVKMRDIARFPNVVTFPAYKFFRCEGFLSLLRGRKVFEAKWSLLIPPSRDGMIRYLNKGGLFTGTAWRTEYPLF